MTIAFIADPRHEKAIQAEIRLRTRYGDTPLEEADYIVVLGGDGTMLHTLHKFFSLNIPFYGMNLGTLGFLMNAFHEDDLTGRLTRAASFKLYPLLMHVTDIEGLCHTAHAFNEVSLLRQTHQAAKIRLSTDGVLRIPEVVCDGILVSTPMGSTAYNFSNNGPILPIDADLLALTPLSPFRPRGWRGALLKNTSQIQLDILNPENRSVSATADYTEIRNIKSVQICEDRTKAITLLFDPEHDLEERVLREQFLS
ncbi:MAG: NAD kinase [Alphaproteobacteria bacterium]|jgi:NAD+ kinase|nr:NAD kinase [Alphaproteobacteria bacterium]